MSTTLRLLILEDDPIDAELEVAVLEEAGYACQWERVETRAKFLTCLDTPDYDAILVDYNLPSFDGLTALQLFLARNLDIPVIFVSGILGEEAAIESLKAGAADYVLKERLSRLAPVMKRALQEREKHQQQKKLEDTLREREEHFRALIQHSSDIIIFLEADGTMRYVSPAAERIVGYSVDPLVTSDLFEYIHPDDVPIVQERLAQAIENPGIPVNTEFRLRHKDGSWVPIESITNNLLEQPEVHGIVINARDITERKRAEEELLREKIFSDSLLNSLPTTFFMFDTQGELIRYNDKFLEQAGLSAEEAKGKQIADFISEQDREFVSNAVQKVFTEGQVEIEAHAITKGGEITPYHFTASRIIFDDQVYLLGAGIDITQRKQAEAKIERALRETYVRLEVSQALASAQTEEQVLDVLAEQSGLYPQVGTEILTFEQGGDDDPTLVSRRSSSFDSGFPETPAGTRFPASEFPIVNLITPHTLFASADVLHDERVDENTRAIAVQEGWGSIAIVPIITGDNWLGIIFAASRQKEYFDPSKLTLYQTLAEQGAAALQIARLNDNIQKSLRETQVRFEISQALAGASTEDEVLDVLIQHAALYPQAHTTILTFDRMGDELAVIPRRADPFESGIEAQTPAGVRIPASHYPGLNFISADQPFVSDDVLVDERTKLAGREITHRIGATSLAGFPLAASDERMGCIIVMAKPAGYFDEEKQNLYRTLAEQGSVALHAARLRAATRESAERVRTMFETIGDGIMLTDLEGRILDCNEAAISMYGFETKEELLGHTTLDLLVEEERARGAQDAQTVFTEGQTRNLEYRQLRCDGSSFDGEFSASLLRGADENPIGFVTVSRDITKRKQVKEERERLLVHVQEQAQRVQQIIETVPEGVILLDTENRIILANPLGHKELAVLADTLVEGTLTRLGDRPLDEILTSPPQGLWHEASSEGQTFQVIARPIETGPTPGGWVLVIRDITQQREIERRTQQQERLAAVGQLAAGIAHDFNNIMAVIALYSGMSLRTSDLPQKVHERLEIIDQQAHRASALIQQIMDFSRHAELERGPLDLVMFLKEQVKLLKRTLPENLTIDLTYSKDDHTINADPTRIQQAIMNLATNARDAMPEGGRLHFGLERITIEDRKHAPLPEMRTVETVVGEWVHLTAADTGTGIPPEAQPHVFDPFFTTKPADQGTGLGLAQVYGIVKQHSGYIDFVTEAGKGTTFSLYLPAFSPQQPEIPGAAPEHLIQGQGQTVLVVEDDDETRKALVESLELLNYRVLKATTGKEALEIFGQHTEEIALVLSDVVMPEMSGRALLHALQERAPTVRVILLTGHPLDEKDFGDLRARGLKSWALKPLSVEQLAKIVAEALE